MGVRDMIHSIVKPQTRCRIHDFPLRLRAGIDDVNSRFVTAFLCTAGFLTGLRSEPSGIQGSDCNLVVVLQCHAGVVRDSEQWEIQADERRSLRHRSS